MLLGGARKNNNDDNQNTIRSENKSHRVTPFSTMSCIVDPHRWQSSDVLVVKRVIIIEISFSRASFRDLVFNVYIFLSLP